MYLFHRLHQLPASSLSSSPSHPLATGKALRLPFFIRHSNRRRWHRKFTALQAVASAGDDSPDGSTELSNGDDVLGRPGDVAGSFCIIEGPETVQDFAKLQLQEIRDNIKSRRNKIFLLMEETTATLKQYYIFCCGLVAAIILFGGFLAPILELKLGLGGTSYEDFIRSMNLPPQLSEVDPIVASFSGGAVGVISSLMVVEVNNVKQQEHKRCIYCHGTGYLACARCSGTGALEMGSSNSSRSATLQRCPNCSGAGRVMCPTCLCTGTAMASEHDPRIDPFV